MSTISSIAVSGVQAASTRMDVAAHNIANAQTPGFQRQQVQARSQETAGVVTTVGKAQEVGADLAADLVEQKAASYQYRANLKTIQTEDQMMGSLLDLKA
jgi:flagellar hook protein FlgE